MPTPQIFPKKSDRTPRHGRMLYNVNDIYVGRSLDLYGEYSEGETDQNYLRGVQEAGPDGRVRFTSIFPAAYAGRWPHVHFEVRVGENGYYNTRNPELWVAPYAEWGGLAGRRVVADQVDGGDAPGYERQVVVLHELGAGGEHVTVADVGSRAPDQIVEPVGTVAVLGKLQVGVADHVHQDHRADGVELAGLGPPVAQRVVGADRLVLVGHPGVGGPRERPGDGPARRVRGGGAAGTGTCRARRARTSRGRRPRR